MFFRNLMVYQFTQPAHLYVAELKRQIDVNQFQPCGATEVFSSGFVPVRGEDLWHEQADAFAFCVKRQERKIPNQALRELVEAKVAEIEVEQERKVYRKERIQLKDEITLDRLPSILPVSAKIYAHIDTVSNLILIDTASASRAEEVLNAIRKAIGSLPVILPSVTGDDHGFTATQWLVAGELPGHFEPGEACEMRNPGDDGVVRFTGVDLLGDEVTGCIEAGHRLRKIALSWFEHVTFTLVEPYKLRGLHFTDTLLNQVEADVEGEGEIFDADMYVQVKSLRCLLQDLGEAFGGWVEQGHLDVA